MRGSRYRVLARRHRLSCRLRALALDYRLCSAVDVGGDLVQHRDSRLCEHGPGKADELALAGGQVLARGTERRAPDWTRVTVIFKWPTSGLWVRYSGRRGKHRKGRLRTGAIVSARPLQKANARSTFRPKNFESGTQVGALARVRQSAARKCCLYWRLPSGSERCRSSFTNLTATTSSSGTGVPRATRPATCWCSCALKPDRRRRGPAPAR